MPPGAPPAFVRALDAGLVAASVLAVLGLGALAEMSEPPRVALTDLQAWEGRAIRVEALVARAYPAGTGAQVLSLADGDGRAMAFWPDDTVVEGAWVRAAGTVERVRGVWELRAWSVEVVRAREEPLTVAEAARLAPALVGEAVHVAGELRWPEGAAPSLAGPGARLLLLDPDPAARPLDGVAVVVSGAVRFDPAQAAYRLEAWEVRG